LIQIRYSNVRFDADYVRLPLKADVTAVGCESPKLTQWPEGPAPANPYIWTRGAGHSRDSTRSALAARRSQRTNCLKGTRIGPGR